VRGHHLKESDLAKMEMVNPRSKPRRRRRTFAVCSTCTTNSTTSPARVREREAPRDRAEPGHAVPAFPPDPLHAGEDRGVDQAALGDHRRVPQARPGSRENSCARTPSTARKSFSGTGEGLTFRRRCPIPEDFATSLPSRPFLQATPPARSCDPIPRAVVVDALREVVGRARAALEEEPVRSRARRGPTGSSRCSPERSRRGSPSRCAG